MSVQVLKHCSQTAFIIRPTDSQQFSPVVVWQDEDEEETGETRDHEEDPEEEVVNLLGEHLPVLQNLVQLQNSKCFFNSNLISN